MVSALIIHALGVLARVTYYTEICKTDVLILSLLLYLLLALAEAMVCFPDSPPSGLGHSFLQLLSLFPAEGSQLSPSQELPSVGRNSLPHGYATPPRQPSSQTPVGGNTKAQAPTWANSDGSSQLQSSSWKQLLLLRWWHHSSPPPSASPALLSPPS